jgi:hypothetical protein
MSFKTALTVEGNTYLVRKFMMVIKRDTDIKGRPASMPSWNLSVKLDAQEDTSLASWMIDPEKQLDGKLTVYKIDSDSRMKEIRFGKSYCFQMAESFKSDISYTSCCLLISGKDIAVNAAELNGNWPC